MSMGYSYLCPAMSATAGSQRSWTRRIDLFQISKFMCSIVLIFCMGVVAEKRYIAMPACGSSIGHSKSYSGSNVPTGAHEGIGQQTSRHSPIEHRTQQQI